MDLIISSLHFKADVKLENFIREKTAKLTPLYDNVLGCEVVLRLDPASDNSNKIAEIKVIIPGNDLFSKKQAKTFEEAVDTAVDVLKRQLRKRKEKIKGL